MSKYTELEQQVLGSERNKMRDELKVVGKQIGDILRKYGLGRADIKYVSFSQFTDGYVSVNTDPGKDVELRDRIIEGQEKAILKNWLRRMEDNLRDMDDIRNSIG